jgi:catechol 2,3-dioxygenase
VSQPFAVPIDLSETVAKLMADTEALVRDNPSKLPMQAWSDQLQKRLEAKA